MHHVQSTTHVHSACAQHTATPWSIQLHIHNKSGCACEGNCITFIARVAVHVKATASHHTPTWHPLQNPPNKTFPGTHLHEAGPVEALPKVAPGLGAGHGAGAIMRAGRYNMRSHPLELGIQVDVWGLQSAWKRACVGVGRWGLVVMHVLQLNGWQQPCAMHIAVQDAPPAACTTRHAQGRAWL
jgi:hypothetical protein